MLQRNLLNESRPAWFREMSTGFRHAIEESGMRLVRRFTARQALAIGEHATFTEPMRALWPLHALAFCEREGASVVPPSRRPRLNGRELCRRGSGPPA
jgi:hypothetical protein